MLPNRVLLGPRGDRFDPTRQGRVLFGSLGPTRGAPLEEMSLGSAGLHLLCSAGARTDFAVDCSVSELRVG